MLAWVGLASNPQLVQVRPSTRSALLSLPWGGGAATRRCPGLHCRPGVCGRDRKSWGQESKRKLSNKPANAAHKPKKHNNPAHFPLLSRPQAVLTWAHSFRPHLGTTKPRAGQRTWQLAGRQGNRRPGPPDAGARRPRTFMPGPPPRGSGAGGPRAPGPASTPAASRPRRAGTQSRPARREWRTARRTGASGTRH